MVVIIKRGTAAVYHSPWFVLAAARRRRRRGGGGGGGGGDGGASGAMFNWTAFIHLVERRRCVRRQFALCSPQLASRIVI